MSASRKLYAAAQVRELDRQVIARMPIAGYTLMQRAAAACWRELRRRRPHARRIDIVCGPGNNGGDGYELAGLALDAGCEVRVWSLGEPRSGTEAHEAWTAWNARGNAQAYRPGALESAEVIVDAIFGTGLTRAPEGMAAAAIREITGTARSAFIVAVDIPSGLSSDTGQALGVTVKADLTVSFIGRKLGLYTGSGLDHAGERVFDSLDTPPCDDVEWIAELLDADDLREPLRPRARGAHKGGNGFVLLIGGDQGYAGAILLAARAALRSGAGLVAVATRREHAALLAAAQPEAMFRGVDGFDELQPLLAKADVIAIGPGLGRGAWGRALWAAALDSDSPLVVDADALNLLAEQPVHRGNWVLTPHPGEAARLLGCETRDIESDRVAATRALVDRYGGTMVLKGAGTLVGGDGLAVCPHGNPGMATGGMGDTLTGIIAALIGQRLELETAARCGVLAHALAGDRAAASGERGLLPSDLIDALRAIVNP